MVAYGNRQNATTSARANNSDLLSSLKHLMETRLKSNLSKISTTCYTLLKSSEVFETFKLSCSYLHSFEKVQEFSTRMAYTFLECSGVTYIVLQCSGVVYTFLKCLEVVYIFLTHSGVNDFINAGELSVAFSSNQELSTQFLNSQECLHSS